MKLRILSPVLHDDDRYEPGEIAYVRDARQAIELVRVGAAEPANAAAVMAVAAAISASAASLTTAPADTPALRGKPNRDSTPPSLRLRND
jgi:hypothetical protein